MPSTYKTPGVYIEEITTLPASIAQVETAIPAFIGFTKKALKNGQQLWGKPTKIESLLEFESYFGTGPDDLSVDITLNSDNSVSTVAFTSSFCLYDSMRMFFSNGGGPCYIVAAGQEDFATDSGDYFTDLNNGLDALRKEDEPTLILFPDAVNLAGATKALLGTLQKNALKQCNDLQDRFCIFDLLNGDLELDDSSTDADSETPDLAFRNNIGVQYLKYGASYYPNLRTTLSFDFGYENINTITKGAGTVTLGALSADATYVEHMDKVIADKTFFEAFTYTPGGNANFTSSTLIDDPLINGDSVYDGYALIPDKYDTSTGAKSKNQIYAKIEYIWFMIKTFAEMYTSLTDDEDEDLDGSGVTKNDLKTIHGKKIAAASTAPPYEPLESAIRTLLAYHEGFAKDGATLEPLAAITTSGLDTAGISIAGVTYDVTGIAGYSTIYGDGTADTYKVAVEESASAFQELYEEVVSIYKDFESEIALRIENLETLLEETNPVYANIIEAVKKEGIVLPPSGAIAGVYAATDNERGVWVAPANRSLNSVVGPKINVTASDQAGLNVDATAGKSINAIRSFTGKGTLVWGARTLAGNSNEWRYIPVRRLFNMVEESVKKATEFVVFEPNDKNTWVRTKAMIENFLNQIWKAGGLAGAKAEHAYIVKIGLGETMTAQDILEGRMIVEIHMAAVRPAEFIILRFMHKLQES